MMYALVADCVSKAFGKRQILHSASLRAPNLRSKNANCLAKE